METSTALQETTEEAQTEFTLHSVKASELTKYMPLVDEANQLIKIDTRETLERAGVVLGSLAEMRKAIKKDFKESKDAANKVHKAICKQENGHLDPIAKAEADLSGRMRPYIQHLQKVQREAEAKAREEERQRQAEEDEKAQAAAAGLEEEGYNEEAEEVLSQHIEKAPSAPAPLSTSKEIRKEVLPDSVKTTGKTIVKIDKLEFLKAAIDNPALRAFIEIKESKVKAHLLIGLGLKPGMGIQGARLEEDFGVGGK